LQEHDPIARKAGALMCLSHNLFILHELKPAFDLNQWVAMTVNTERHINLQSGYFARCMSFFLKQHTL